MLTTAQLILLKNEASTNPAISAAWNAGDNGLVQIWLNSISSPNYWVYRSNISKDDICNKPSVDETNFSWTIYIARSQGERDAWREIFSISGTVDATKENVRQAFMDIFSGGPGAPQRTHLAAKARRLATNAERVLVVSGTGTTGDVSTPGYLSSITLDDVRAMRLV